MDVKLIWRKKHQFFRDACNQRTRVPQLLQMVGSISPLAEANIRKPTRRHSNAAYFPPVIPFPQKLNFGTLNLSFFILNVYNYAF